MGTDLAHFRRAKEVFLQVRDRPENDRESLLREICGADSELRVEVLHLLEHDAVGTNTLEQIAVSPRSPASSSVTPEKLIGHEIGQYHILEHIGEGGFGNVYVARQSRPVHRLVALKVIKPGMDTKEVLGRFEAERQILARLEHPSIARVYEAGSTPEGRPYFAMELVRGQSIKSYCEDQHLYLNQRLELFLQVCAAVHHAHQKGVIHRDLKSANVLVTERDDRPLPKVIDFGVAKAVESSSTDHTYYTSHNQLIGTPGHMSPEQAKPGGNDIDIRTDVYSLGVLLYELLTGVLPFDPKELRDLGSEFYKVICNREPPKPSARVLTPDATDKTSMNGNGRTKSLSRHLRGDLDWIVLKALEKDRKHRYQSVTALMDDIERFLNDEIPTAGRPSTVHRVNKFTKRHKLGVGIGTLAAAGIIIFTATVMIMNGRLKATNDELRKAQEMLWASMLLDDPIAIGGGDYDLEAVEDHLVAVDTWYREDPADALRARFGAFMVYRAARAIRDHIDMETSIEFFNRAAPIASDAEEHALLGLILFGRGHAQMQLWQLDAAASTYEAAAEDADNALETMGLTATSPVPAGTPQERASAKALRAVYALAYRNLGMVRLMQEDYEAAANALAIARQFADVFSDDYYKVPYGLFVYEYEREGDRATIVRYARETKARLETLRSKRGDLSGFESDALDFVTGYLEE